MIPIIAAALSPLLKGLFSNGLDLLGKAILTKGKDVVEQKLGVKLPDENAQLDPTQLEHLRALQFDHEEALIELAIKQAEVELDADKLRVDNTKDARSMNVQIQMSANAEHIAKVAAYYLDFIIVLSTVALAFVIFFVGVPVENKELAYTAFGSMLTLCGTIINFHRGTSASSKSKDGAMQSLINKIGAP